MASVLILNGPNLNLLGTREPEIYGSDTLSDLEAACLAHGSGLGIDVECRQSNHEGALLDHLHAARDTHFGVVLNAGAFTHTSIALYDAIVGVELPVIEVHISNVHSREAFRHTSVIAPATVGQICGFGPHSYILAMDALMHRYGPGTG